MDYHSDMTNAERCLHDQVPTSADLAFGDREGAAAAIGALDFEVYCVGTDGRCTFINQAGLEMLGHTSAEERTAR
jgi:PAS domain-containing protein